jgi:hypothetical protein
MKVRGESLGPSDDGHVSEVTEWEGNDPSLSLGARRSHDSTLLTALKRQV